MKCELCHKRESVMSFNTPMVGGMFQAELCVPCWSTAPNDAVIANIILSKRCMDRGITPETMTNEQLVTLLAGKEICKK